MPWFGDVVIPAPLVWFVLGFLVGVIIGAYLGYRKARAAIVDDSEVDDLS